MNANLRCFKDHPCVMGPCIPSVMFDKLLVLIFVISQRNMHAFVLNQCLSSSCFFFFFDNLTSWVQLLVLVIYVINLIGLLYVFWLPLII